MIVKCQWCERDFEAQRSTAKYCSDRCRVASNRDNPQLRYETYADNLRSDLNRLIGLAQGEPEMLPQVYATLNRAKEDLMKWTHENYTASERLRRKQNRP